MPCLTKGSSSGAGVDGAGVDVEGRPCPGPSEGPSAVTCSGTEGAAAAGHAFAVACRSWDVVGGVSAAVTGARAGDTGGVGFAAGGVVAAAGAGADAGSVGPVFAAGTSATSAERLPPPAVVPLPDATCCCNM